MENHFNLAEIPFEQLNKEDKLQFIDEIDDFVDKTEVLMDFYEKAGASSVFTEKKDIRFLRFESSLREMNKRLNAVVYWSKHQDKVKSVFAITMPDAQEKSLLGGKSAISFSTYTVKGQPPTIFDKEFVKFQDYEREEKMEFLDIVKNSALEVKSRIQA